MKNSFAIYGGHDASVTFVDKNDRVRVVEIERYVKQRYAAFSSAHDHRSFGITENKRIKFLDYLYNTISDPDKIETILFMGLAQEDRDLIEKFFPNVTTWKEMNHHVAHAYCGHFQSGFDKSIIFSIDGGGIDHGGVVTTKAFLGEKEEVRELVDCKVDFGTSYMNIGKFISEIKKKHDDSLAWAGKIMGLCAYGKVREEWVEPMIRYYNIISKDTHRGVWSHHNYVEPLKEMLPNVHLVQDCLSGQDSYDLAATSQFVFEKLLREWIQPLVHEHKGRNVVLVGGCALNVLYNQELSEHIFEKTMNKLYVPPNPNDCGLSLGFFLEHNPELRKRDFVYDGIELLDKENLESHISKRNAREVTTSEIVDIIKRGEIIGMVYGDSEIGPRALGNRSIICDPSFDGMKDILNKKVKFREWYRPFAPVCMLNESNTYFHKVFESHYMSFAPKVKEEYHEKLKAITHIDETSRLQTVSKVNGHKVFTEILEELKSRNEIPVILNTSFNIRGFPILTTIEDALHVLDNTELDHVVIEGYLFSK